MFLNTPSKGTLIGLIVLSVVSIDSGSTLHAAERNPEPRIVQIARPGSPEATVQAALVAALESDEDKGFEAYLALIHPKRKVRRSGKGAKTRGGKSKAIQLIRLHSWKRFKKRAADYVLPESNGGFTLTRMAPQELKPSTTSLRLFLAPVNNERRTISLPIRLERVGDMWFITANSL